MTFQQWAFYKAEIISEIQKSPNLGSGVVMGYAATQFDSYPAVVVTPANSQAQFADTSRNQFTLTFNILCFFSRLGHEAVAESALTALVDDVTQRLANNAVLNNNQNTYCKPVSTQWGYSKVADDDTRTVMMTFQIVVGE